MTEEQSWREQFPVLERTVYMISNSLGAMPRKTADDLAEYAEIWATRGVRAWEEHWWEMARETGNRVARIIKAPPDTVSMHENVTTAHMVALSTLEPTPAKNTIVCQESDFPSMLYLFQAQQRAGFKVHIVPAEPDLTMNVNRVLDAIDDSTLVVCLSHVLFKTSYITEARAVIERAHRYGARRHPGRLPVGWNHSRRRHRSERGHRGRGLSEMAVRRSRGELHVHASRPPDQDGATVHRLGGTTPAVRIRSRRKPARRRHATDEWHAGHSCLLRGPGGPRHHRAGRRRRDSAPLQGDDGTTSRTHRPLRLHQRCEPGPRATRRYRGRHGTKRASCLTRAQGT